MNHRYQKMTEEQKNLISPREQIIKRLLILILTKEVPVFKLKNNKKNR